jgi:hypothetical protein
MGRSVDSYSYVAVELTKEEAKVYLGESNKTVDETSWGDDDENFFEIVSECGGHYDVTATKPGLFSSHDYEDEEIYNIFYGYLINSVWASANYDAGVPAESVNLSALAARAAKLEKKFPKKKIKIVNLLSIG